MASNWESDISDTDVPRVITLAASTLEPSFLKNKNKKVCVLLIKQHYYIISKE